MHDRERHTAARLERVLAQRIRPALYPLRRPLAVTAWHVPGEPVTVDHAFAADYEPFDPGTPWGPPWSTMWLHLTGAVPADWAGRHVDVLVDLGFTDAWPGFQAEGLAFDALGVPVKGISPRNHHVPVAAVAAGTEPIELFVEAAANPMPMPGFRAWPPSPLGDRATAGTEPLYRFEGADLAVRDEAVWHLIHDLDVLSQLGDQLPPGQRRAEIWYAIGRALDALDLHAVNATAQAAREVLAPVLARPAHASAHLISAVGHAHIDTAWLWPLRETVRKATRTFATVTQLATEYPELVFAASQAQQYAWIRERRPQLWQRIAKAVADGTFVPVGGMWVESDTNLPGGEALARQLIHGKRFFLEAFGVETREVWLPDSFGYSPALPQLARLAGNDWFLTQKLSWNAVNRIPHSTFWWEGIDGTRVFTHMPPVDTYNAELTAAELNRAQTQFADAGPATMSLVPFGYGDGGGGPNRDMLERARRLRDLDGSPAVTIRSPAEFFAAAQAEYADAPVWVGELYLELHRATYTTQAKTKAGNRRSEHLLREAELWAATAALHRGAPYPYERLERVWQQVLTLQFHDILPGSSIAWVNREAREAYEHIQAELEELIAEAATALRGSAPSASNAVLNAAPHARDEVVVGAFADGQALPDGRHAAWASAPALGIGALGAYSGPPVTVASADGRTTVDNGLLRVVIDGDGLITSAVDARSGRDAIAAGQRGNLLQLHPDHPNNWDAWDIDPHYRNTVTDLTAAQSVTVVADGPLLAAVEVVRVFGASTITQTYRLTAGSARFDVETVVDWRESEKVLKAAFPLGVHTDQATAEIQFGHLRRPIHTNTSWDDARFEIWAHRWLHVGEPSYGVAVLNDATYGHDVTRGPGATTVRLTLVRAPHSPDPQADQDVHRFAYALMPGAGVADATVEGYRLNLPLRVTGAESAYPSLVTSSHPGVIVEAVKLADDRSGDVIVRLYEARGDRAETRLTAGFPMRAATIVDLLERHVAEVAVGDREAAVALRPFQILTLRLSA
ncbi:glycoside hydrolase family 38 C-terminal domain-containing protein [Hamadaea sp. NPDC051192]|uniref:alpha-mannosidase n=1 Tax=Hamadaea sp. NPDC051192 TaxID=3154940 RepID=UPI00344A412C